jgi:hypothetical protein
VERSGQAANGRNGSVNKMTGVAAGREGNNAILRKIHAAIHCKQQPGMRATVPIKHQHVYMHQSHCE